MAGSGFVSKPFEKSDEFVVQTITSRLVVVRGANHFQVFYIKNYRSKEEDAEIIHAHVPRVDLLYEQRES